MSNCWLRLRKKSSFSTRELITGRTKLVACCTACQLLRMSMSVWASWKILQFKIASRRGPLCIRPKFLAQMMFPRALETFTRVRSTSGVWSCWLPREVLVKLLHCPRFLPLRQKSPKMLDPRLPSLPFPIHVSSLIRSSPLHLVRRPPPIPHSYRRQATALPWFLQRKLS